MVCQNRERSPASCHRVLSGPFQHGVLVLECAGFQPFACALQREIDIPIFGWGTLLDYAYSVAVHRD
jgi:hypothetical protein